MAQKTSQVGRGQVGAAQIGSTTTSGGGSESFALTPSSGHTTGAIALTANGTSTLWSGSPFSIAGGGSGSATITSQSVSSNILATININVTVLGTINISDGVTTATYDSSAVVPNAPTSVVLTDNHNGTVTATYTQATDTGGSAITANSLLSSNGDTGTAGSPGAAITFTPTNGVSITAQVRATNAVGNGPYSLASGAITPNNTSVTTLIRDAPYYSGDVLPGTPSYQKYQISAGALAAVGSSITTGFNAVPNVTGGYRIVAQLTANGSFGDNAMIGVFPGINTSVSRAIPLNSPATSVPTALIYCEVAPFSSALAQIGTAVAQTLTLGATTGTNITILSGGAAFASTDVGRYILSNSDTGRLKLTTFTDSTHMHGDVIDTFASTSYTSSGWNLGAPRWADSTVSGVTITAGTMAATGVIAIPGVTNGYVRLRSDAAGTVYGSQIPTDWDGGG